MRIGVLTGGGDVPGLKPCIKAISRAVSELDWEVVGFRRGWAGPLNIDPDTPDSKESWLMPLGVAQTRTIDRTGGTVLHTSRTNPGKVKQQDMPAFLQRGNFPENEDGTIDCTPHVERVLDHLGIDALLPIGGDDTLSYAAHLHRQGMKILSIPKTMDNDVFGTDYCIGFSTAVSRSVEFITALRTPAGSHERIAVIELFGRNSGETALMSGFLADADRVVIPECPVNIDNLAQQISADRARNPSRYAIIVVSEGAMLQDGAVVESGPADAYGHRKLGGVGTLLSAELKNRTGINIINQSLAYLMRAGAPDSLDRMVASAYGTMAVQLLADGVSGKMMALQDGNYSFVDSDYCIKGEKRVDVPQLYDPLQYRPRIAQIHNKPMFLY